MGSRTTWIIKTDASSSAIHLYSHWGGDSKFQDTKHALAAAENRWSDVTYGARIFMSQIIGENWASENGFGIAVGDESETLFEESYFNAVLDFPNQIVTLGSMSWTFSEFALAENVQEILVDEFYGVDA